jgi:ABC-type transport system involved in cytochrome c biogenesis permease component
MHKNPEHLHLLGLKNLKLCPVMIYILIKRRCDGQAVSEELNLVPPSSFLGVCMNRDFGATPGLQVSLLLGQSRLGTAGETVASAAEQLFGIKA